MTWSPKSSSPLEPLCGRVRTMTEMFSPTSWLRVSRLEKLHQESSLTSRRRPDRLLSLPRFWISGADDVGACVP